MGHLATFYLPFTSCFLLNATSYLLFFTCYLFDALDLINNKIVGFDMKLTLHTTPPNPSNDINSTVAFRSSVGQYGYLPPQETAPSLTHKIRGVSGKHLVTTSKYNEMSYSN